MIIINLFHNYWNYYIIVPVNDFLKFHKIKNIFEHLSVSDYAKNFLNDGTLSKELSKQMAFYLNLKFLEEISRNQGLFSKKFLNEVENYIPLPLDIFKTLLEKQDKLSSFSQKEE